MSVPGLVDCTPTFRALSKERNIGLWYCWLITDVGLAVARILTKNGRYSNELATIPVGNYSMVGIVYCRYNSVLYHKKGDYTYLVTSVETPAAPRTKQVMKVAEM
jgi:hypothetical protein